MIQMVLTAFVFDMISPTIHCIQQGASLELIIVICTLTLIVSLGSFSTRLRILAPYQQKRTLILCFVGKGLNIGSVKTTSGAGYLDSSE